MPGQNPCLHEGQLRHPQTLVEQWMIQTLLLTFLIRFDDEFAPGLRELDRAAFPFPEMLRSDLLTVDQRDGQSIRQPRSKLLHQIQRQRWTIRTVDVQVAHKRIESRRGEGRDAVMPDEGVEKG